MNNLQDIKDSSNKASQDNIKDNTFFKLTIKDTLLSDITWDGSQKVDIVSKDETKSGTEKKKYGSFTLQYKVKETDSNWSVDRKTNLIIGKITSSSRDNDLSSIDALTCKIKDDTSTNTASSCSIFKIDETISDVKNITATSIKDATTSKDDYAKDKYFVIDLKQTTKKDISEFSDKTVIVLSDNTDVAEFAFQTALLDGTETFAKSSKTIILS